MIDELFIGGEEVSIQAIQRPVELDPIEGSPYMTLQRGDRGAVVTFVQDVMIAYFAAIENLEKVNKPIPIDPEPAEKPTNTFVFRTGGLASPGTKGSFDITTEVIVKAFQESLSLPKTGKVDRQTWNKIYALAEGQTVGAADEISSKVLSLEISLTMDSVSQLTIDVADPGLLFTSNAYWAKRRKIKYLGLEFEIAAYSIGPGSAGEQVKIEARSYPAQRFKRDKSKYVFTGGNATAYAAQKARDFGLKFFGENVFIDKKSINQVNNDKSDESAWDVLKRLASESQFVMFESAGWLFFCSQQFLLGKFAVVDPGTTTGFYTIPIHWLTEHNDATYTAPPIASPGNDKLTPGMKFGDKGEGVAFLQRVLQDRAGIVCYYIPSSAATSDVEQVLPPYVVEYKQYTVEINKNLEVIETLSVDKLGEFGRATERAVKRFNSIRNIGDEINGEGKVTVQTWNHLTALAEGREYSVEPFWLTALQCPECRTSDDDQNGATISFQVEREKGRSLRPGMTVDIVDIPGFIGSYLITEVRWLEGTVGSVSVSARTPIEPADRKKAAIAMGRIDLTGGGYSSSVIENQFGAET